MPKPVAQKHFGKAVASRIPPLPEIAQRLGRHSQSTLGKIPIQMSSSELAPHFVALPISGHCTLDMRLPSKSGSWRAWKKRDPWFPEGRGTQWSDVYRTWFGNGELPIVNLHLMGSSLPSWDEQIRRCYEPLWREAVNGGLAEWESTPKGLMAKLILVDQLPRHIFRGKKEAFSSDALSLVLAERLAQVIASGRSGLHIEDAIMVALPWVHSERVYDIYRAVWWHTSLSEAARGTPYHFRTLFNRFGAENHIYVLQRFGRYPHRNTTLGRASTSEELEHLKNHAEIWELQQSASCGTFRYKLRALRFFFRMAFHTVGSGESRALWKFLASALA